MLGVLICVDKAGSDRNCQRVGRPLPSDDSSTTSVDASRRVSAAQQLLKSCTWVVAPPTPDGLKPISSFCQSWLPTQCHSLSRLHQSDGKRFPSHCVYVDRLVTWTSS